MIAKAKVKYLRISSSKVRLVVDLLKGKTVEEANFILDNVNKKACQSIRKVLNSAFSNANNNRQDKFLLKDVFISGIRTDGGPMLKRYRAATMGRATPVKHRTSHIYVELDKVVSEQPKKRQKTEKRAETKKVTKGKKS